MLLQYHLMEDDGHGDKIRMGLERKLDSMVLRELYGKSKSALTEIAVSYTHLAAEMIVPATGIRLAASNTSAY